MSPLVCPHCGHSLLDPEHVCPRRRRLDPPRLVDTLPVGDPLRTEVEFLRDSPAADGSPAALWRETVFTQVGAKLKRLPPAAGHALPSRAVDRARRRGAP